VTFAEDHSQVRTGHGPTNLACLRTLAINALRLAGHTNITAGLRQHAQTPLLPLATLGSHDDFAGALGVRVHPRGQADWGVT
jgi:hypothetical protein